ncbi:MAG: PQQ-binding-like beta-propeller repeat protein [Patescibacteria group bacterium]|nr:PQQ-binding-like beta-propeller repeat protein [Patescibacteria group bacterium]
MFERKIYFTGILLLTAVFVGQFFCHPVLAAPAYNQTTGVYTDDFADNTGFTTRSYVNVNAGKLQLTHDDDQTAFTAPYKTSGYAYSAKIIPTSVAEWGTLSFDAVIPEGTTLKVQVYDYYDADYNAPYSDIYLTGNSTGFSTSPIDISGLPIYSSTLTARDKITRINIKVTMTTTNTDTPTLDNLQLTWTTSQGDLTAQPLYNSPWPTELLNNQGTLRSAYANSSVYPAFKWARDKKTTNNSLYTNLIYDGKIYYSDYYEDPYLYAINRDTGVALWQKQYFPFGHPSVSQNGTFYEWDISNDTFIAVDLADGSVKWTYASLAGHGNAYTTIGDDGMIYFITAPSSNANFTVYAMNPDGSVEWTKNLDPTIYDDLIGRIMIGPDDNLYLATPSSNDSTNKYTGLGRLYSLSPTDGAVNWSYEVGDVGGEATAIDDDGVIYVGIEDVTSSGQAKKIYAFNSDGSVKWSRNHLSSNDIGYYKFALRSDNVLVAHRYNASYASYYLDGFDTADGDLLWSIPSSYYGKEFFLDKNNGLFEDYSDDAGVVSEKYYDADRNLKWKIYYNYSVADGTNSQYYYFGFYRGPIMDERGWLYGGFSRFYYDASRTEIVANEFLQYFALAPWTLTNSSSISGIKLEGDTLNFSATTSMLETNPLFGGTNQVQVVLDNGDKVPLSYSSTAANGDTVWTGSYTFPKSGLGCGTHSYTVEASQTYLQTDITTHFASAPTNSNNTGITASGTFTSIGCGGGFEPEAYNPPTPPTGAGFQVIINNNDKTTNDREVTLNLIGGPDTAKISLSNTLDFKNAIQENYQATKQWDLCSSSGNIIKNTFCPAGEKIVYAKFFTKYGVATSAVFDAISYQPINTPSAARPLNIGKILGVNNSNTFLKDLKLGQTNFDVKRLQIFLNSDPDTQIARSGPGSPGQETFFFGSLTKLSVIKFQEKYAEDILVPLGLKQGTGFVSKNTRLKINELMGK